VRRDPWLYLIAGGCGAAIWIFVATASGRAEAWDSPLYFTVGIPALCLVALLFGLFEPDRWWRWGVAPIVGQFVWMLVSSGPGNLLPLGAVAFAILALPSMVAARIGAFIGVRTLRRP
jgi:hypothetical protein